MKRILNMLFLALTFLAAQATSANSDSPILPISSVTPGATNPDVTQANINSTICVSGYTKTIRPSSSYTTGLKREQLAGSYSLYHDSTTGDFEEDHLISLELGGSPSDPKNLWPEPYAGTTGARLKDRIENKLHTLVCTGQISLHTAQVAIAKNWYSAYQKYIGVVSSNPSSSSGYSAAKKAKAPVDSTGNWPDGATGKCVDGTYSYSAGHRGMCSRHGGVEVFRS
jgi:hypothetical protein